LRNRLRKFIIAYRIGRVNTAGARFWKIYFYRKKRLPATTLQPERNLPGEKQKTPENRRF